MSELKTTAILLIAHGSQNPDANADAHYFAAQLRQQEQFAAVESAFLELADPDIDGGAARCVANGAKRVVLLPYFLSPGMHVRRDLAAARQRLAERYAEVEYVLAEPLGRHPMMLEILHQRIREAR
jgi:sirohydrochlorin ferrochelatase